MSAHVTYVETKSSYFTTIICVIKVDMEWVNPYALPWEEDDLTIEDILKSIREDLQQKKLQYTERIEDAETAFGAKKVFEIQLPLVECPDRLRKMTPEAIYRHYGTRMYFQAPSASSIYSEDDSHWVEWYVIPKPYVGDEDDYDDERHECGYTIYTAHSIHESKWDAKEKSPPSEEIRIDVRHFHIRQEIETEDGNKAAIIKLDLRSFPTLGEGIIGIAEEELEQFWTGW